MVKPELLAPAGGMEQLKTAMHFGADAVYAGGPAFGLRANAANFTLPALAEAAALLHAQGKQLYVTANAVLHPDDMPGLSAYFDQLRQLGADAVIVSDAGAFSLAKKAGLNAHISTQASVANADAVKFWRDAGASRVVLARELSLSDIEAIRRQADGVELEAFVHGAMCMAYSGRCLISGFLAQRSANRGDCAHACRWRYRVQEQTRRGVYIDVEEDARGSYIFNACDLNMLRHLRQLEQAGVSCFKIEGRMKSAYYVGTVVNAYRTVLDDPRRIEEMAPELDAVSHRPYSTGFYFGPAKQDAAGGEYLSTHTFVGVVRGYADGEAIVEQRNRFFCGDTLQVLSPGRSGREFVVERITDMDGRQQDAAPHPQQLIRVRGAQELCAGDILRKRRAGRDEPR